MGDITTSFIKQYSANVDILAQQMTSRMKDKCRVEDGPGNEWFFEQIDSTTIEEITTRDADTPYIEMVHQRRFVAPRSFAWSTRIDKWDRAKMLIDPQNPYLTAGMAAMERRIDKLLIDAASGAAMTGATGSTSTSLPSGQKVAAGGVGMTTEKLVDALQIFLANEVDTSLPKYCALSSKQIRDLLNDPLVTSADYNLLKPLVTGQVVQWMGFTFVPSEQLTTDVSSSRLCPCWVPPGLCLAVNFNIEKKISERADKNYAIQPYIRMQMGATRMQEEMVVEIACVE